MEYVYAVYSGCKYEGGGVNSIWSNPVFAVQEANILYESKAEDAKKIWKDRDESEFHWKPDEKESYWNEDLIASWSNAVDVIQVWRYRLNKGIKSNFIK